MKQKELIKKIKLLKKEYENEGFCIIGLFGSYARGDYTKKSDVDILYQLDEKYIKHYKGWNSYIRLDEIKQEIYKAIGKKIDMADKNALNNIGKKYILEDIIYVK